MQRPATRPARPGSAPWAGTLLALALLGTGPSCSGGDPEPGPPAPAPEDADGVPEAAPDAGTDPDPAGGPAGPPSDVEEGTAPAPAEGPDEDAAPEAPGDSPWPAVVEKDLYAVEDLRGRPLGEVEIERWITEPADWEGKTLLVHFFTSWSRPCLNHVAEQSVWTTTHPDLVVLGITVEPASSPSVQEYLGKWGARYPLASCPSAALKTRIGVTALPHSLLVSSDGIVRWQGFPADEVDPLDDALLRSVLEADRAARAARGGARR